MANDQVQVQTFNWGPCVIKVKIEMILENFY